MAAPKKGLGSKGLGIEALINNKINDLNDTTFSNDGVIEIDINKIEPNSYQPRKIFDESGLEELSESIKIHGIIQPVILKKMSDYYELVAGERRWRAAKIAGIKKIPAIIKDYDISTAFEISLVENLQRENLNPMEEALSYKRLIEEFDFNQEQIAAKVGKSRSVITNAVRLLNLDKRVQNFVFENKLTNGHARALLAVTDNDLQFELAEKIIENELSVRAVENLVKAEQDKRNKSNLDEDNNEKSKVFETENYYQIEDSLKNIFGTKVKLSAKKNKGKIEIEYYSNDDLDRLLSLIKNIEK